MLTVGQRLFEPIGRFAQRLVDTLLVAQVSRLLGVDLGPRECGFDPGVEQFVSVGQAKGQQRGKALSPIDALRYEVVKKAERQIVQLAGVEVDAPSLLSPDVIRLEPGDGLETLVFGIPADVVHPVTEIAIVEMQSVQCLEQIAGGGRDTEDRICLIHRPQTGIELRSMGLHRPRDAK